MDKFHHVPSLTNWTGTLSWFGNTAAIEFDVDCLITGAASEEG
jgi:hypothetical protein